jgi:hypothetical protein
MDFKKLEKKHGKAFVRQLKKEFKDYDTHLNNGGFVPSGGWCNIHEKMDCSCWKDRTDLRYAPYPKITPKARSLNTDQEIIDFVTSLDENQCRSWLCEELGWLYVDNSATNIFTSEWRLYKKGHPPGFIIASQLNHPFPLTLDGANSAIPETYQIYSSFKFGKEWTVSGHNKRDSILGRIKITGKTEQLARYRFAIFCRIKEKTTGLVS